MNVPHTNKKKTRKKDEKFKFSHSFLSRDPTQQNKTKEFDSISELLEHKLYTDEQYKYICIMYIYIYVSVCT